MSATPTRDWLAAAIRESWRRGCDDCWGQTACPAHAAVAVLDVCREARAEAYEDLAAELDRWDAHSAVTLGRVVERCRQLAAKEREGSGR